MPIGQGDRNPAEGRKLIGMPTDAPRLITPTVLSTKSAGQEIAHGGDMRAERRAAAKTADVLPCRGMRAR